MLFFVFFFGKMEHICNELCNRLQNDMQRTWNELIRCKSNLISDTSVRNNFLFTKPLLGIIAKAAVKLHVDRSLLL